jgi:hypothetical protein
MTARVILLDPPPAVLAECSAADPANPFYTPQYVEARRSLGERAGVMQLRRTDDGAVVSVPFFLSPLRLGSVLEVPSLPAGVDPSSLIAALTQVVRRCQAVSIALPGFASPDGCAAPPLPWPTTRCSRTEFVIDLTVADLHAAMSRSHRQRARQGQRSGLTLVRRRDAAACLDHTRLMGSSMSRRRDRGEEAATAADAALLQAYLQSGAGELFQAVKDDVVYSSMLLLHAPRGAYDQSSGTSSEGMSIGAAQFLIAAAGQALATQGIETLNLGGVREHETGLRAFKSHFGARENTLVAAVADTRSRARKLGESLWHRLRRPQDSRPRPALDARDGMETGQDESIGALR